jgi:cellulose synthase/poly-beta-1,6-N-acetylglucosamine synthase-like glycosyltransferase
MTVLLGLPMVYLTVAVLYLLFFTVVASRPVTVPRSKATPRPRFLIVFPAYKEDAVIVSSVQNALSQPDLDLGDTVVVLADQLKPATWEKLGVYSAQIINIELPQSTKARAINQALPQISTPWDAVLLMDADNHLVPGAIRKAKETFMAGREVIQLHRMAKNLDTPMAKLDALSEEVNNTIFRKGHVAVGLSSALIGSGLVMDRVRFERFMAGIDAVSGFDKQLELDLLKNGQFITYLEDAFVLDEKVRNEAVFETQRTRWLAAQWRFAKAHFFKAFGALFRGKIDYADKVFQFILPPRIVLLGLLILMSLWGGLWTVWSGGLFFLYLATLWRATPRYIRQVIGWNEIKLVPQAFWSMLKALSRIGQAKKKFLHTPHQNTH